MSDLRLERTFKVAPERLFDVLSKRADTVRWWGHDGWTFVAEHLDFSRTGPWFADMRGQDGTQYKLSGQVTKVSPPHVIGFTWAWHDAEDQRGHESHVTLTVQPAAEGAKLVLEHRDLPSDDVAAQHARGWGGPLGRLEKLVNSIDLSLTQEE